MVSQDIAEYHRRAAERIYEHYRSVFQAVLAAKSEQLFAQNGDFGICHRIDDLVSGRPATGEAVDPEVKLHPQGIAGKCPWCSDLSGEEGPDITWLELESCRAMIRPGNPGI